MKSDYITRAKKFMVSFMPYFESYKDIRDAVRNYNRDKHRHVEYYHGIARRCLCLSDYAVKWDYDPEYVDRYGGCEMEMANYKFACDYGYSYLFAEITQIKVYGYTFYVMPRITTLAMNAGTGEYNPNERLSCDEYEFVYNTMCLCDLHDENWGFLHGEMKIIDYANTHREE